MFTLPMFNRTHKERNEDVSFDQFSLLALSPNEERRKSIYHSQAWCMRTMSVNVNVCASLCSRLSSTLSGVWVCVCIIYACRAWVWSMFESLCKALFNIWLGCTRTQRQEIASIHANHFYSNQTFLYAAMLYSIWYWMSHHINIIVTVSPPSSHEREGARHFHIY